MTLALSEHAEQKGGRPVTGELVALDGAKIVAEAMRQMNPDVVAAYPITPQTEIVQTFSEFVANGEVATEFVTVESEHAAMSACIGAAASGGRVQTATTSAGMAFMWEVLYVAASCRLPIVMHFVNRALSAPLNIHCDHSDSMGARDSGWIQLYAENVQEAYDNAIQSVRIAEHPDVLTPVLHSQDGFIISHGMERAEILPDAAVQKFIGPFKAPISLLDVDNPITVGPVDLQDYYFEHKRQQVDGMDKALQAIIEVGSEWGKLTGRPYGLIQPYMMDDADVAIAVLGSTAGTVRTAVDELRAEGIKAGLLKIRCFRPFPSAAVAEALRHVKALAVLDRAISFGGAGNPLFMDVCTAMVSRDVRVPAVNYVYGLGGRDTVTSQMRQVYQDLLQISADGRTGPVSRYLGLRE
ncbi:MAG: pyruvate ferredoxin oxidoreductase [Chloroflexota bacterium]|nr:MAG: pyruvate ferredoxin oxidoreductase [Chloroflexota bacterium]